MNRKGIIAAFVGALGLVSTGQAETVKAPQGSTANQVVEYYYSDATRPVLMDFRICSEIHEEGPEKHNCKTELAPADLREGTEAYLWMKFLVPREAEPRILMQLSLQGITRDTFNRQIGGAIRYRTWNRVNFTRAGEWKAQLFYEDGDNVTELMSRTLTVAEADETSADEKVAE